MFAEWNSNETWWTISNMFLLHSPKNAKRVKLRKWKKRTSSGKFARDKITWKFCYNSSAIINDNFFILNANELREIWFLLQYIKGLKEILHVKEYGCRCNFGYLWPRVWLALLVLLDFVQLCTLDLRSRFDWPKSPWASTCKIYLQHFAGTRVENNHSVQKSLF